MNARKTLAAVMAVLCMTGAMPAVTSSAATYDSRDVNHDGSVDILDVIAINHHLAGTKYYLEYNQLDANQSHTVDHADTACVMNATINNSYSACYIRQYANGYMQPVTMPKVSSSITLDSATNTTSGRTYRRYSYTQGKYLSNYTLTPNNMSVNATSNQSRTLIGGDDNRGVAHGYENEAIVCLGDEGTGFIVGDHTIATAASCVYQGGQIRTDIVAQRYDRSGELVETPLNIAEIHVPTSYSTKGSAFDYALITVTDDLSGYIHFDIGNSYNMTNSEVGTIPIHVTGQPNWTGDSLNNENTTDTLYTHNGSVYGSNNTSLFYFNVDATDGQEGAPVYTITRETYNGEFYYTYTALSLYAMDGTGWNRGPVMNKHHLLFYGSNPNVSYE